MADVYLSYSRSDLDHARMIADALQRSGMTVFWDAQIRPGEEFGRVIVQEIASSRVFVLILSEAANVSPAISRETSLAADNGLTIVPYRIGQVTLAKQLEYLTAGLQWIDGDDHRGVDVLVDVVQRALGKPLKSVDQKADTPPSWLHSLKRLWAGKPVPSTSGREAREASKAARLTSALLVHRLEDIDSGAVLYSMRQDLVAIVEDLPERLERVSRQAAQFVTLQNPSRQINAAESALRELSSLKSELLMKPGALPVAMSRVVDNWSSLFTAARVSALARIEEEREIENPFIIGNPVQALDSNLFTGRRDIVLEIERSLVRAAQAPTLLLYGQRRMGKTSILNQLPNLLGPGFLPVLVDCQAPATVESQPALLRHLSRCLAGALNSRLGIDRSDERARRTRGALDLPIDELKAEPYSVFEDWLDVYQTRLHEKIRILVCLDEFERLGEIVASGWGTRFLDALRHWLQHRPRFGLMFVGSHTFEQLGSEWTDRFISARRLKVSFLRREDVRHLLTKPTPTFNLRYAPGALETIQHEAAGQPFLTQVLASELVHHLNRKRRKEATQGDVAVATAEALERSAEYFADVWFSRAETERQVLRDVARGIKHPPTNGVARELYDYDLLNADGDFAVPLVGRWVRKHQAAN